MRRKVTRSQYYIQEPGGDGPRIACYIRVSTGRQAREGFSIDAQKEKLSKMVELYKPSQIHWCIDAGMTGTKFDARQTARILQLAQGGKIDELWVSEIDRIGRKAAPLIIFLLEFLKYGKIRTSEETYEGLTTQTTSRIVSKAITTEDGNDSKTRASVAGMRQSFKRGNWNKPVSLGYLKPEKRGWIQKDPIWEPAIPEIYALYLNLKNYNLVTKEVNKKYPNLSIKLTGNRIRRILNDPVYIGKPSYLGETFNSPSLAMVSEDLFQKCQEIQSNMRKGREGKGVGALERLAYRYPDFYELSEFIGHIDCGGSLVGNGPTEAKGLPQEILMCTRCGKQGRVPTKAQVSRQRSQGMQLECGPMPPRKVKKSIKRTCTDSSRSILEWVSSYVGS